MLNSNFSSSGSITKSNPKQNTVDLRNILPSSTEVRENSFHTEGNKVPINFGSPPVALKKSFSPPYLFYNEVTTPPHELLLSDHLIKRDKEKLFDQSVCVEKVIMSKQLKALNAVETY